MKRKVIRSRSYFTRTVRRMVKPGGIVKYDHMKFQHDELIPYINIEILVRQEGFEYGVDFYECLYPYGTKRNQFSNSNKPIWVMGRLIVGEVYYIGYGT